ncbi:major facilitator superfamily transporter [Phlyctema vagabunda]|uniref:Major facilitator superfamily transporter n=1 Tax=Phlyctema vagabunda TaxID=108571 RepID=A0ABR4PPN7_9HELO
MLGPSKKRDPPPPARSDLPASSPPPHPPVPDLEFPDGGYGWVQVLAVFLINAFTWGQTASYGVYLAYYLSTNRYPTATSLDYAFIGGLQISLSLLIAPIVTILTRRLTMHACMLLGIGIQTTGFIAASYAHEIWHLYVTQGVLLGLGLGFISVPANPILSQWFSKRRSLATGISSAGSGIGGLIFSFASSALMHRLSLAWAFRITALTCAVANLVAVLLIRNRNAVVKPPQLGFDTQLLHPRRRSDVLLFLAWAFVSLFGYTSLLYSLSPFASALGLSNDKAAAISAFLNLGTAVGRPAVGFASDRFGRIEVAASLTFAAGLACFAFWIPAETYAVTAVFAVAVGAVFGVFWMTVAPIAAEVAGVAQVPSLLSITWLVVAGPALFTEVIALKLRRLSSSKPYLYPQVFAGTAYIVAALCLIQLRIVLRKRNARELAAQESPASPVHAHARAAPLAVAEVKTG